MRIAWLAASLLASAVAEARIYDGGITHAELRALMLESGLQAVTVEAEAPDEVPRLVVVGGPARWYAELLACKDGRCGDLHLSAGYNLDGEPDAAAVREFNDSLTGWISGNIYIDDERDPIFQSDANTDGASGNNIRYAVTAFDDAVRCVSVIVGFDDTPDACKDFPGRLRALQDRGLDADDVSRVVVAVDIQRLERILRDNGFASSRGQASSGLVSLDVEKDGVRWSIATPENRADQVNASLLMVTGCGRCGKDAARRANLYNAERRWITARAQPGIVTGSMTLPLAGGVTEDAIGMMIRSFHSWAVNFSGDMPD
jgi:hypothetical protein